MKPTGVCDICKSNPAQLWWGKTSKAICSDSKCGDTMYIQWKEYEAEFDKEQTFRKELEDY